MTWINETGLIFVATSLNNRIKLILRQPVLFLRKPVYFSVATSLTNRLKLIFRNNRFNFCANQFDQPVKVNFAATGLFLRQPV